MGLLIQLGPTVVTSMSKASRAVKNTARNRLHLLQASEQESQQPSSTGSADTNDVQPLVRDADNVLSCLKRALKIANAARQQLAVALKASDTVPAFLYVEILNQYLYYFEQGLPNITSSIMQVSHCWDAASVIKFAFCFSSLHRLWRSASCILQHIPGVTSVSCPTRIKPDQQWS